MSEQSQKVYIQQKKSAWSFQKAVQMETCQIDDWGKSRYSYSDLKKYNLRIAPGQLIDQKFDFRSLEPLEKRVEVFQS